MWLKGWLRRRGVLTERGGDAVKLDTDARPLASRSMAWWTRSVSAERPMPKAASEADGEGSAACRCSGADDDDAEAIRPPSGAAEAGPRGAASSAEEGGTASEW